MHVKTPEQKRAGLREVGNRYSEKRRGHRMNSRVHVRAGTHAAADLGRTAARTARSPARTCAHDRRGQKAAA